NPMRAEVRDAVDDPVDVLLDRDHHVAQDGRAARPGDGEEVREARDREAERRARPGCPLLSERQAVPAAQVDGEQGARDRIKPVPSTIVSSANSSSPTRRPLLLISSIGRSRIETSRTLSRL